ncbi:hypothetical protein EXIGLDRAFT_778070 [Exidia glandulosa HHB12029]|uniref:Uncharacterized protein n=1 Tax=Exidia glandulosa HHB12029 TaxID=1314781 RepID=A0A165CQZ0_EXIGL|nr:hypothetical protein EXIGLDRAFT_778070 [Exidia glandulosa HHB12029]
MSTTQPTFSVNDPVIYNNVHWGTVTAINLTAGTATVRLAQGGSVEAAFATLRKRAAAT